MEVYSMTDQHPITPPLELVEQWECEYHHMAYGPDLSIFISEKAARWGADQELEACCEYLTRCAAWEPEDVQEMRDFLYHEPPSLKKQELAVLDKSEDTSLMSNQYPVTVLSDLIEQLESDIDRYEISTSEALARAYAAGADQELEACCEWLQDPDLNVDTYKLRTARRPKPPSLKEQALAELDLLKGDANTHGLGFDAPAIRRALESLPD
jgi:hypothetical protein